MNNHEALQIKCWDNSLQTFGFSYIFARRAQFYSKWTRFLTLLGIIVPLVIGTTATGYGIDSSFLKWLIWISVPLSIIQVTISAIALVNNWDAHVSYSLEAMNDYGVLSDEFKKLAQFPSNDYNRDIQEIETRLKFRSQNDGKYLISDLEKRIGMKWALREFRRQCAGCKKVPISMDSTNCPVCGNYKKNYLNKLLYHG